MTVRKTNNPASLLKLLPNGVQGFHATAVQGPDVDLVAIAGFEGTDELSDAVWGAVNWETLLLECPSATVIEEEEFEGGPGLSDTFYRVEVDDPVGFAEELRSAILLLCENSAASKPASRQRKSKRRQ